MKPTDTRDASITFTAPKDWNEDKDGKCGDLPVRVELYGESRIVQLVSTWEFSSGEREHIARGGVIEVMLCTPNQPAMAMAVVDPVGYEPATERAITLNESAHGNDHVEVGDPFGYGESGGG